MRRTTQPSQSLPESIWGSVVDVLLTEMRILIVRNGTPDECGFSDHSRLIDLRGQLSIHELQKVIAGAVICLGADFAPFYVAAATTANMVVFSPVRERNIGVLRGGVGFKHSSSTSAATGTTEKHPCEAPWSSVR